MKFVCVGLSHRTAPLTVREGIARAVTPVDEVLSSLRALGVARELCIISTCNRVEIYAGHDGSSAEVGAAIVNFLAENGGGALGDVEPHLYIRQDDGMLAHLFRVASSLDSMVLGEPQILGQVKDAFRVASNAEMVGPGLQGVFERAFSVAKRVRSETGIAENAVSMSFAAVELGREIFESLSGTRVLLIGAGKMSMLAAKHLQANGVAEIRVANRSLDRAQKFADEIGGSASSLTDLELLLGRADIVISSTAAPTMVVDKDMMSRVVRARRYRSILFVDIAVPRDIDPTIAELDNVFVYDVDDLEAVVADNRASRAKEAEIAERIVAEEVIGFQRRLKSRRVVPVIKALRHRAHQIAAREAARASASLEPHAEAKLRAMSEAVVNKLLHPILQRLKADGGSDSSQLADQLTEAFDLDIESDAPPERSEGNVVQLSKKGNQ